ncbi:MAG: GDSL-type esterase/lipase family protein [Polyangiaceae bacterium]
MGISGIPSGFPTPTAANYAMCQKVAVGAGSQTPTSGAINACAGQDTTGVCIECLFGGSTYNTTETPTADGTSEAGNYLVTVDVGGAAAGSTYISAESERGLLAPVTTTAGQTLEFSFVVNARAMEGQPDHAGGPGGYPGLDLFFYGPAATPPQVSAIGYQLATAATKPIMVYLASDSTECDQTGGAFGGWGQMLPEFFLPPIGISNWGNSGASSSSFYGAYWGDIKSRWTAGDYAIIQFGHNDKGVPDATVQANLEKYITDALAANVTPIIVSPPARVQFGNGTTDGDQSSLHEVAAKAAAAAHNVAFIPLTDMTVDWYNTLGSQAACLKFHANDSDATHTNLVGGQKIAALVAGSMQAQGLPLAKYLRPGAVEALAPIPIPAIDGGTATATGGGSPGDGGASGGAGGGASKSIQCGATMCGDPSVCCESMPDAGGTQTPACVVGCDYTTQVQLCGNSNDCQAGPPNCVNGICAN